MASRQIILFRPNDPEDVSAGMAELGSPGAVERLLRSFNIAPDGGQGRAMGTETLYGPGLVLEIPSAADAINQLMVTVNDQDTAWSVLARMCRELELKMMDPETGQTFM
ncbi:MAG TPA: hypothetical protein ENJ00_11685 [Phycisphaerales bacterium]|nr:hypothetical protein [Phycisphaerales bacterium]